jgi:hypothetical protein
MMPGWQLQESLYLCSHLPMQRAILVSRFFLSALIHLQFRQRVHVFGFTS